MISFQIAQAYHTTSEVHHNYSESHHNSQKADTNPEANRTIHKTHIEYRFPRSTSEFTPLTHHT